VNRLIDHRPGFPVHRDLCSKLEWLAQMGEALGSRVVDEHRLLSAVLVAEHDLVAGHLAPFVSQAHWSRMTKTKASYCEFPVYRRSVAYPLNRLAARSASRQPRAAGLCSSGRTDLCRPVRSRCSRVPTRGVATSERRWQSPLVAMLAIAKLVWPTALAVSWVQIAARSE